MLSWKNGMKGVNQSAPREAGRVLVLVSFLLGPAAGSCSSCGTELVGDAATEETGDLAPEDAGIDPHTEPGPDPDAGDPSADETETEGDAIEDLEPEHEAGQQNWILSLGESNRDEPGALLPADDGNVIAAGWIYAHGAGNVLYIVELDPLGRIVRQRAFKPEGTCEVSDLTFAPGGGLVVAGRLYVDETLHWDAWIVRLDAAWDMVWQKALGGDSPDSVNDVAVLADGSIAAAGGTRSFGLGQEDLWIFLLDGDGEVQWQKSMGGESSDTARAMFACRGGDILVLGETASFGLGSYDMWLVSFDRSGSLNWQETLGSEYAEFGNALMEQDTGSLIAAGSALSPRGAFYDFLVMKLDARGGIVWQKILPVDETDVPAAIEMRSMADHFIVAGRTSSLGMGSGDLWVIGMDDTGALTWQRTFGSEGSESAVDVTLTTDHALVVAGVTNGLGESAALDWVVARLNDDGGFDGACSLTAETEAAILDGEVVIRYIAAEAQSTTAAVRDTHAEEWDYLAHPVFHCPP
jgi:hypothetical protein